MTQVLSGGVVYEYTQETGDYGLVTIYNNHTAELMVDYDNLQEQFNKLDVKSLESGNITATKLTSPKCQKSLISSGSFNNSFIIPSIPSGGQKLIDNGISNPQNGKMIPVTQTKVPMAVYDSNNKQIDNLAIRPLQDDQSNTPNGVDTSGPSSTSSGASPTPTKKGVQDAWRWDSPRYLGPLLFSCFLNAFESRSMDFIDRVGGDLLFYCWQYWMAFLTFFSDTYLEALRVAAIDDAAGGAVSVTQARRRCP